MTERALVMIVEDDRSSRVGLEKVLRDANFDVIAAEDGQAALRIAEVFLPDIVITDFRMPNMDGLSLLSQLRQRHRDLPVIVATAAGELTSDGDALRREAASVLTKPIDLDDLFLSIAHILAARRC